MEDDLNKNENGSNLIFLRMKNEDIKNKWKTTLNPKWKMTSKKMEDDLKIKFKRMEDDLKNKSKNGRQPQAQFKKSNLIGCDIIVH